MALRRMMLGLAMVSCLGGPASAQAVAEPVLRSFNWFDHAAGTDVRSGCRAGTPTRIRLIYNAVWEEQVRAYELEVMADGTAHLSSMVWGEQGAASAISVSSAGDLLLPWRPKRGTRLLAAADMSRLTAALEQSAAFGPAPAQLTLHDADFWWSVASCRAGSWGFQAYHHPTDGFARASFAAVLFDLDPVATPVNRPRALEPAELRRDPNRDPRRAQTTDRWRLEVGRDGVRPR